MYCPQCGTQNDNSAAFCGNCGTKLSDYNGNSVSSSQNAANTIHTNFRPTVKYSSDPVLNEMKKLAVSPLMIITALAFSLMIILYISNAEAVGISVMGYLRGALETAGIYELKSTLSALNAASRLLTTLVMLPQIIIAVGIWMTVYSAFNKTNDTLSISGLKTIRVINVITLILNIVATIAYFCGGMWLLSKINESIGKVPFLIVFVLLIVFAILIFEIFYVKKIIDFIDCIIYSIQRKIPFVPSRFIGVMMFIGGGAYAMLAFMVSGSQNWFGAITYICFGLIIFSYVSKMCYLRDNLKAFTGNKTESEQVDANENQKENFSSAQNVGESSIANTKKLAIVGIIMAIIIAVVVAMTYTAPGVDKALVGKWQYGSSEEATFEFKRNGVFIGNAGTEYEETGTYTVSDNVVYTTIDGEITEHEYRIISSDKIQIEREYIDTYNWERKTKWETLYRVK